MAKLTGENKRISELKTELIDCAIVLGHCEEDNAALKKELSQCKNAANSDDLLLASGLRLALANEALKVEVAVLRKDLAKQATDQKTGKASPAQP
jgi:hypothetical protein